MRLVQRGYARRPAAALIGSFLMILAGMPMPAAAAVPTAAVLKVVSPANGATLHSLDLTVSGIAQPGIGILVCVGDAATPSVVASADADAVTGAFSLNVVLPPLVSQYPVTVQALTRPLPARCAPAGIPGLASVTRTVTVPTAAILSVDIPTNRQVLKTPQFTVNGSIRHGSSPYVGVRLCLVGPDHEQLPLDLTTLTPGLTSFAFSETLQQAHMRPAIGGDYTLIVQTFQALDETYFPCDPTAASVGVPTVVRTIAYRPDTTPPVIRPGISGQQGRDGWYTSDVTVSWSVSDPNSALLNLTGCATTVIDNDTPDTTLTCSATSIGGSTTRSVTIKRDTNAPSMAVQFAPEPAPEPGMPSRTVIGTATVRNAAGTVVGTMDYVNCYFVPGLSASLGGVENANGSGVTSLTYAATGAQKIATTTVSGFFPSAVPIISAPGATTLTAWSRDQAGLRSTNLVANFVSTSSISCAGIAFGVVLPTHGTLEVSGTVTDGATAQPFQQSISF